MAAKTNDVLNSEDSFDLTSMIDVVFLMLIYFMFLPIQQEADLLFSLPTDTEVQSKNAVLPSEQVVDIKPDGSIFLNGALIESIDAEQKRLFPDPKSANKKVSFDSLSSTLRRLKQSADRNGISTIVSIYPDADAPHQASIAVLNACAEAGIKQVSFAEAD